MDALFESSAIDPESVATCVPLTPLTFVIANLAALVEVPPIAKSKVEFVGERRLLFNCQ